MGKRPADDIEWRRLQEAIGPWLVGYGLLTFHIGIYLLAAAALVLLNLYRSPAHFHVQGPLLWWGLLVLLHAAFVVVRTNLARASASRQARPWRSPAAAESGKTTGRFSDRSVLPGDGSSLDRARQFVQSRVVQPVTSHAAPLANHLGMNGDSPAEPPATMGGRATDAWPKPDEISEYSAAARGRALLNLSATRARDLAERAQISARDALHRALGESDPVLPDGASQQASPPAWPSATNGHSHGAPPPPGVPVNGVPRSKADPPLLTDAALVFPPYLSAKPTNGHATNGAAPPGNIASSSAPPEPPHKTDPKTEWTWMEAAAAAWLARREPEEGSPGSSTAPSGAAQPIPATQSVDEQPEKS